MPRANRSRTDQPPGGTGRFTRLAGRRLVRTAHDDEGNAPLEFIVAGLLLLVPIVYLIVALGQIQNQTLGAEAGARHVARAISLATDRADADTRAQAALAATARQYGIDPATADIRVTCTPTPGPCPDAGATVRVEISTRVTLPLAPPVLGLDEITSVPVSGAAVQKVGRLWSAP